MRRLEKSAKQRNSASQAPAEGQPEPLINVRNPRRRHITFERAATVNSARTSHWVKRAEPQTLSRISVPQLNFPVADREAAGLLAPQRHRVLTLGADLPGRGLLWSARVSPVNAGNLPCRGREARF